MKKPSVPPHLSTTNVFGLATLELGFTLPLRALEPIQPRSARNCIRARPEARSAPAQCSSGARGGPDQGQVRARSETEEGQIRERGGPDQREEGQIRARSGPDQGQIRDRGGSDLGQIRDKGGSADELLLLYIRAAQ